MSSPPADGGQVEEQESPVPERNGATRQSSRELTRRLLVFGVVSAFVGLLAFGLWAQAPERSIDQSLADGEPIAAPGFELALLQHGDLPSALSRRVAPALADERLALAELRGVPVVLNFWASWCVPCREEAPVLARSWRRFGPRGILFVGLNMQDLTEDARQFMADLDNDYLNVRDQTDAVAGEWGVTGIPETFFITGEGRVVGHVIGVVSEEQLDAGVAAMRSGQPLSAVSGGAQRSTR